MIASQSGKYGLAWEHAIRAQQAGGEMQHWFERLRELAPQPGDLEERLTAPTVFVDTPSILNPVVRLTLERVLRRLRGGLSDAPRIALVPRSGSADYVLELHMEDLSDTTPRSLKGSLELHDAAGERRYRREFSLSNVDVASALSADLDPYFDHLLIWLSERK